MGDVIPTIPRTRVEESHKLYRIITLRSIVYVAHSDELVAKCAGEDSSNYDVKFSLRRLRRPPPVAAATASPRPLPFRIDVLRELYSNTRDLPLGTHGQVYGVLSCGNESACNGHTVIAHPLDSMGRILLGDPEISKQKRPVWGLVRHGLRV